MCEGGEGTAAATIGGKSRLGHTGLRYTCEIQSQCICVSSTKTRYLHTTFAVKIHARLFYLTHSARVTAIQLRFPTTVTLVAAPARFHFCFSAACGPVELRRRCHRAAMPPPKPGHRCQRRKGSTLRKSGLYICVHRVLCNGTRRGSAWTHSIALIVAHSVRLQWQWPVCLAACS